MLCVLVWTFYKFTCSCAVLSSLLHFIAVFSFQFFQGILHFFRFYLSVSVFLAINVFSLSSLPFTIDIHTQTITQLYKFSCPHTCTHTYILLNIHCHSSVALKMYRWPCAWVCIRKYLYGTVVVWTSKQACVLLIVFTSQHFTLF